jgi:hypothetical protein
MKKNRHYKFFLELFFSFCLWMEYRPTDMCTFTRASSGIRIPSLWFVQSRPDVYHCGWLIVLGIKTQYPTQICEVYARCTAQGT